MRTIDSKGSIPHGWARLAINAATARNETPIETNQRLCAMAEIDAKENTCPHCRKRSRRVWITGCDAGYACKLCERPWPREDKAVERLGRCLTVINDIAGLDAKGDPKPSRGKRIMGTLVQRIEDEKPPLPLTSIGPSGVGGYAQNEADSA